MKFPIDFRRSPKRGVFLLFPATIKTLGVKRMKEYVETGNLIGSFIPKKVNISSNVTGEMFPIPPLPEPKGSIYGNSNKTTIRTRSELERLMEYGST